MAVEASSVKRVVVTGGTGFVGGAVVRALLRRGDQVTVFSRRAGAVEEAFEGRARGVAWRPEQEDAPEGPLAEADAVVHLAGEPAIGMRWTDEVKRRIEGSRVEGTRRLVATLRRLPGSGRVLVSASGVGYYGNREGDETCSEAAPPGGDFLARVCVGWEAAAREAEAAGVRVVLLRIGVVLAAEGGALEKLVLPFRMGVGGPIGTGRQWVSFVHLDDVVGAVELAVDAPDLRGPVNVVAPNPVQQEELARAIGRRLRRPSWLRVPGLALRARFGEGAEPLLGGQRAVPEALLRAGFAFRHPELDDALAACLP